MRARGRIALGFAALAATAGLVPAAAEAGISSQLVPISGDVPVGNTQVSDVETAPNGDALVAWSEGDATNVLAKVRRIHPDGTVASALTISDGTQRGLSPKLAVTADGRTLVTWLEGIFPGPNSIRGRWLAPDDTLGPQFTIRNGGIASDSGELTAEATSTGGALVAWHNFVSNPPPFRKAEARRVNPNGTVGGLIFPVSTAGSQRIAVLPDTSGGALFSWREGAGESAQHVDAADALGALATPYPASASAVFATDGANHFRSLYRKGSPGSLEYRDLALDGTAGTERTIDPASSAAGYGLATNAANRSVALWSKALSLDETAINARLIEPDGTPAETTTSFTVPTSFSSVVGGISDAAEVPLVWVQLGETKEDLFGRTLSNGQLTPIVQVSSPTGDASTVLADVGGSGQGVVAWSERIDPANPTSLARVYLRQILPPPACPDATATIVQGRPTSVGLGCTGVQLGAPAIIEPPAHGTLAEPDAGAQSVVYTPKPGFAGTDTFRFAGTNPGGNGTTQSATLTVGADTVKPKIKRFKLKPRRVAFQASAKPRKPKFKLRYSEPATATILIERRNQCPKADPAAKCRKFKRVGKLRARQAADSASVKLKPKLGKRRLGPGRYRASAVAKDLAGNRSRAKRLSFSVQP